MTRSLLLAALMALSLNAQAYNMLSPFSPFSPFSITNQMSQANRHKYEDIKTHKCKVVQPTKAPCKAPCNVCYKDGKQVTCGGSK